MREIGVILGAECPYFFYADVGGVEGLVKAI